MTKEEIKREARAAGYQARYSAKLNQWFFSRLYPSRNSRAFDAVALHNLKQRWGAS